MVRISAGSARTGSMKWVRRAGNRALVLKIASMSKGSSSWNGAKTWPDGVVPVPTLLMRAVMCKSFNSLTAVSMSEAEHVVASRTMRRICVFGYCDLMDDETHDSFAKLRPWRMRLKPEDARAWA